MQLNDRECVAFLQWCLPHLQMTWNGFRKVRRQVCKRIKRRLVYLDIKSLNSYQQYLMDTPSEWLALDNMMRINISRFYRDKGVFSNIVDWVFPDLVQQFSGQTDKFCCWSIGCGSGEEVFSILILWEEFLKRNPSIGISLNVIGTSTDPSTLERARQGVYSMGSIKEIPQKTVNSAFIKENDEFRIKIGYKQKATFLLQDIRKKMLPGTFHIIFCRNLIFTYFDTILQEKLLNKLLKQLLPGGFLIIGKHECLPGGISSLQKLSSCIFKKLKD
ncbi:CheR family methyltransferase [Xanthovirga aplysinae]|uniref:CheR family methyltransferase n=1 Tax=Xanthovirga aplysinae TaxID=2529853 RepID=UPI0012BB7600|nr:CheR family methyltransferase [Xanthovirga aplysinae]MTI33573.1 chemotaxis protein CheR [Xanthovirga aplysinae]